jgi:aarF domain-containing kinase
VLDVGIVTEYSDCDHRRIIGILSGFVRKDGRSAGAMMVDDSNSRLQALNTNEAAIDVETFISKMEALTQKASGKDYFMEYLGSYISHICNCAAQHHVMMNPAFITAALAVKVQEGIALALDPGTVNNTSRCCRLSSLF